MVKKYLTACAALLMLATASVDAQTLYAGIGRISPSSWGETNGTEGRIVSFDLSDPSTFTGEFCRDVIGEYDIEVALYKLAGAHFIEPGVCGQDLLGHGHRSSH